MIISKLKLYTVGQSACSAGAIAHAKDFLGAIDVTADPTNYYYHCSAGLTRFPPLTCTKVSGLYAKLLLQ